MPNKSTVFEKGSTLPGGGGLNPILRQNLKLENPMQPQLVTQPIQGSVQPVQQQMPQQMTPPVKQNYFAQKQTAPAASFTPQKQDVTPTPSINTYTPSATNPTQSVYDYLLAPSEEEKKLYKDNESKKRLLLLSDALRHIGNIYNTTRGATPQQFTSPVVQQEQLYQQKKQELQAQRAAALKNSMDQAKLQADQNYKNSMLGMRQAELERGLANDDWNRQFNLGKFAWQQDKDKNDFALKLAAQGETQRHNKVREGQMAVANRIAQQNANTSASKAANIDLKDMQPIKIAKGNTGYISKRWINSAEGRTEIKAMYTKMRGMRERLPNGKTRPLIDEATVRKNAYGETIGEPSTMDMLVAMQKGAWSQPFMEWIGKYGVDPTGINWTPKSPTYYKKVAKGKGVTQQTPKPQSKPKATPKPSQNKQMSIAEEFGEFKRK